MAKRLSQAQIAFVDTKCGFLTYVAAAYEAEKKYRKAISLLDQATKIDPSLVNVYWKIAKIYQYRLRDRKKAFVFYEVAYQGIDKALKPHPNDAEMLTLAGCICEQLKKLDEAITYYQRSLQINDDPKTKFLLRSLQKRVQIG